MRTLIRKASLRMDNQQGQTIVEYGLILFLVSIAAVATLTLFGTQVLGLLDNVVAHM